MEDVRVKLKASLGMDTSDVTKAMEAVRTQIQGKPGPSTESDSMKYVTQWLERVIGKTGSFIDSRKKLLASYQIELANVRQLEEEYRRLRNTQGTDPFELKVQKGLINRARGFTNTLRDTINVGTAQEQLEREVSKGSGGMIMAAKDAIMKHPIITATIGAFLTAKWLKGKADDYSEYSEKLDLGFADLGRRIGAGVGLRGKFEPGQEGHVSPEMKALGFSGMDVLKLGEAYGIPGAGPSALTAQGRFARAFGFGQNAEEIGGIGRRATQLGIAEPNQQPAFWRSMTDAVLDGIRNGIDASETMRSLLAITEEVAAHTGVVSREFFAGLAGIQKAFASGDSRFFKGDRGAEQVKTMIGAFTNPTGIAQTRFLQNSIMRQFGGQMPGAEDLGLKGSRAEIYGEFTDQQKLKYILESLPEFAASKNPKLRFLLGNLAGDVGAAAGGDKNQEQLLFQSMFGFEGRKAMEAQIAMREAAGPAGKGLGRFGMLSRVFGMGGMGAEDVLRGQEAPAATILLEEKQQLQKEALEGFSRATSDATLELRTFIEQLKESASRGLAEFEKRMRGEARAQPQSYIAPMIEQSLEAQAIRTRSMGSTRPRQLSPMGV